MLIKEFVLENEKQTKNLAKNLGENIKPPFYIALKGDLGAGKTTFVQGLAKGIETDPAYYITSPTYNIIQTYPGKTFLIHSDLYRIYGIEELELTGFNDLLEEQNSVLAVEWPEKIENDFDFDLIIEFKITSFDKRKIRLISCGRKAELLLKKISF
ncbi:MAG: tRNA (adenosine(37)-N6)-threonylcarbamoyltransferase complex ATPase subunit type 1 TsaE [Desulforegulaceae bacterium]|nr:tRNA (adenosine(37)-N6)-threonylcarbamoyltransferase complex ATPase subunit type 1 TsaE [Desulforegulaceae bacterium]